jgi:hypothetical protein
MTTLTEAPTNGATPIVSPDSIGIKASFQAMLAPSSKAISRKAWGIDVSTLWVPYFTAARAIGALDDVELPDDALGAPFRLRRDPDTNEVKFSRSGRPLFTVAPHLNDMVNRARDNYVAGLMEHTRMVMDERPEAYRDQVERQQKAGSPIVVKDQDDLDVAMLALHEAALAASQAAALAEETEETAETATPARRSRKTA